jgi:predicted dehydrogenase
MNDPIRLSMLSFAHYHANFWAQAIIDSPHAVLSGIWDDDRARGEAAAEAFGVPFEPNLSALLDRSDAVGITSETVNHAPLVESAAAVGVHVLCEKPMATSLAGANRIEQAVRESGIIFMQNFPKRFDPINHELVDLVHGGELGKVGLVRIRHGHHHGLDADFTRQWYCDPALSGGGTLLDEGIHAADFLRWLLGDPLSVQATSSRSLLNLDVEDTAAALFTFPSGTIAEVTTSWSFIAAEQSIELYGTEGTVILSGVDLASRDSASPPYLRVFRRSGRQPAWNGSPRSPGFLTTAYHQQGPLRFIDCVGRGWCDEPGLESGRRSLEMILAAYVSASTGTTQQFDWSDD